MFELSSRLRNKYSLQFSPVLVRQKIAVLEVNEMSIDARPIFSEAGVLAIPTLLEKSIGASVVGKAVGSLDSTASRALRRMRPQPTRGTCTAKGIAPDAVARAYVYFVTFPIRFLLCSTIPRKTRR